MEVKDIVSISISSLAFVLSLIATIVTLIRGRAEKQRAVKKEISDTLSKIVSNQLEIAKLFQERNPSNSGYTQQAVSILQQQNGFLLQQAQYLSEQVPDLMTVFELNTIAAATATAGDVLSADSFYQRAISVSPNDYCRSLATRSYAGYLFAQRRFEPARDRFRQAVSLLTGGDNHVRFTNGATYQMWALHELNHANSPARAKELFESAEN